MGVAGAVGQGSGAGVQPPVREASLVEVVAEGVSDLPPFQVELKPATISTGLPDDGTSGYACPRRVV